MSGLITSAWCFRGPLGTCKLASRGLPYVHGVPVRRADRNFQRVQGTVADMYVGMNACKAWV